MALTKPVKPAGTWIYEDLLSLPDDGRRYEIIEGELFEMPSPNWAHIAVVMNLVLLLGPIVRSLGGRLATAPADVFFPGADPVQPDILAILPGSRATGRGRGVEGVPDLVVEVLSPSNRVHDLLTKRALYARAGVREYWIVDPANRAVEIHILEGNAFRAHHVAGSEFTSPLLGNATFSTVDIFADLDEFAIDPDR